MGKYTSLRYVAGVRTGESTLANCCQSRGLETATWNGCGVSLQDMHDMINGLDLFGWDIVCLQEGLKNSDHQNFQDPNGIRRSLGLGRVEKRQLF